MIEVSVYENGNELITRKYFPALPEALDWANKMGISGVSYTIVSI